MNKRIRELMGKTLDDKLAMTWDTMTHEGLLQFSEKFAELIVRECADIAKNNVMNISTYRDAEFVDEQIKKHFGVEL